MKTLQLQDTEVCTSSLTQRSYRAIPCEFLVRIDATNQQEALKAFAEHKHTFSGLHVTGVSDLSFLADVPNLLYLEVVNQKRFNTRLLDGLSNLRGLRLDSPGAGIDFSCFPELEVFVGDWHADNTNLHRCQELRRLHVWQFKPKSQDLGVLARTTRLESLMLTQTDIRSLAGVETLEDLRYFEIAYAAKLESLDAFSTGNMELRELAIAHAKKIKSYEPIVALRRLRRLRLSSCAPMPDLKWTQGMEYLDNFSFVETNVEDGDLSPLLQLPRLRYAGTMDKKHYSHKFAALNTMLEDKAKLREGTAR